MRKNIFKLIFGIAAAVLFAVFIAFKGPGDRYFEIAKNLDIFATLYKEVNTFYVDEVNPAKVMESGINAMLSSLDPYTNYISEDKIEDYRTMTTGQYGGIGAIIGNRNDKVVVLMPYENFPAHKAGLKIGDLILSIDGVSTDDKNTSEVSELLKGQAGTSVTMEIERFGTKNPITVELKRDRIKINNVPYYGMVTNDIGYIRQTEFTTDASREVKQALSELKGKGAEKVILDLRGNPGGLLNEAVNISNIFVPKGKEIVSTKGKIEEWNKTYRALNPPSDTEIPIAVLTGSSSASASEIVAGVIQDYDRGILVGEKTFGKGLVQTTRPLSYNSQLKITTAKYYTPSGRCIQAIDYSNRNEDGSIGKIPDSLQTAFKTANGRVVYDGGGITPDIVTERKLYAPISQSLVGKFLLFDYAVKYASAHKSIPSAKEFSLTDEEYNAFVKWLKDKDYDYTTNVEKNLKDLEENAKKEKYYDDVKDRLEALRKQVMHNKETDLQRFKSEVKELLEQEIASVYYLQNGIIEASFDSDEDIQAAIKVLNDKAEYAKILSGK